MNTYLYYKLNSRDGLTKIESKHNFKIYEKVLEKGLIKALTLININN